ncbi:MAG: type II secretion system protein M [Glaciecola sp.]
MDFARFTQWFQHLETREQRLLKIGAVFVVLGCLYWLIWAPLQNGIAAEKQTLQQQQQLAVWVAKQKARVSALQNNGAKQAKLKGSLVQAVNSTASYSKIQLTRIQPKGDEVQVWIDEVTFGTLLVWLDSLEKTGVNVRQIDIAQSGELGTVKVRRLELTKA